MIRQEPDTLLRRLERNALVACVVMTLAAIAAAGGRPSPAIGVLGGAALVAVSYWAIKSGIDGLIVAASARSATARPTDPPRRVGGAVAWAIVKLVGRYAVLAALAYVMIVRLRLHPIGLIAGASCFVAAAAMEALRVVTRGGRGA